jgi:hypothetical protein
MLTCCCHPSIISPPVSSREIIETFGLVRGLSSIRKIWVCVVNSMPFSPVNQWHSRWVRKLPPLAAPAPISVLWKTCTARKLLCELHVSVLHVANLVSSTEDFTYSLLTPYSTVLLQKLTGLQLAKKFPAFYGTRKFITAFTSVRHLSLSWASSVQFIPPRPTSWRSILILSSHLRLGLPSDLFPSGYPTKTLYTPLPSPSELHAALFRLLWRL